ncbi:hypothetical protein CRE_19870 [Caenorhabditis remanei]|uniref:Uncharacterized protein n=1 Tax=Caenorhabditis remanei TaxID=31234 RepID=E3MTD9_CAERE|nr:hypothetical protein CRE_19870 [Caenorhabditis remanei]
MLTFSKLLLIVLAIQSMFFAQAQLYTEFTTVTVAKQSDMYKRLQFFESTTKVMYEFDGADPSADYTSVTWFDDCYREFKKVPTNIYVVFWIVENTVYCEAVAPSIKKVTPRFPVANLMRVELPGNRCA